MSVVPHLVRLLMWTCGLKSYLQPIYPLSLPSFTCRPLSLPFPHLQRLLYMVGMQPLRPLPLLLVQDRLPLLAELGIERKLLQLGLLAQGLVGLSPGWKWGRHLSFVRF